MDYNENDLESDSDEEEDSGESSESDEDESGGSEDDDDKSDCESVESNIETVHREGAEYTESLKAFSSDDDPERECCPICLNKFIGQNLGAPESCDHTFCFECIKEWSKNINTCPIDRTEFNYIHVKANSSGTVLRKVEVKVEPKEPENALEERPTLCEICHSGDREDRLLLCDGCDIAYHCECLDPPLFYIPIEEWFCPTCIGVFDSRAVAGPSHSGTRRVIPRTRASEAVRSRVQNLRSIRTSRSSSVSQPRSAPKKRKHRSCYRRAIKKVVTLARTKKDVNANQKGKLGARSSAVIVTYKRIRRRRRKRRKKVSKKSAASNKVITLPSSKRRLAKHLGIGKPLQGSTVPQIKKPTGSRAGSTAVLARLPTHSLFGDKDQLMDFSENFNEDIKDTSSTSFSKSTNRSSIDACPSTSSGISILDSIMAGQKILHAKPDKILIKTDGSLILKEDNKKNNNVRKIENDPPSHTPMSIALAKQGVRTSLSDKNLNASCKKHADSTKTKNVSNKRILKSSTDSLFENKSSVNKVLSESCSKLSKILNSDIKTFSGKEIKRFTSETKNGLGINAQKIIASEADDSNSFTELDGLSSDIPSNKETSLIKNNGTTHLNVAPETKNLKFDSLFNNCSNTVSSLSSTTSSDASTESYIKREIISDKETNNDSISTRVKKVHIKQEILSDEETNIDSWSKYTDNREQEFHNIVTNIKKEPIDLDFKADVIKDDKNLKMNRNILSETSYENDFDASQSIIDSVPYDVLNASQINKLCKNAELLKVKEEIPSDTEEFSQSLILDSASENLNRLSKVKSLSIKKEPLDSNDKRSEKERKEKICHQNKRPNFIQPLESRSTEFSSNLSKNVHSSSENEHPCTQAGASLSNSESEDDNLPCSQALLEADSSDSEDEIPCTQAFLPAIDSEGDDIPCTQVSRHTETDSEDDLPCTQAVSFATAHTDADNNLSHTQAIPNSTDDDDDDIPYTQVASISGVDSAVDDDIPSTQVAPNSEAAAADDIDIPCTQAACISSKNSETKPNTLSSFDINEINNCENTENLLPSTQYALCMSKNKAADGQMSSTKIDFEFKKPSDISIRKNVSSENHNKSNKNASKHFLPTLSEYEPPSTQPVTFSAPISKNKDESSNKISNNFKSVTVKHGFDFDDMDDSGLPSTQVSSSNPKQISDTVDINSNFDELSNIPATQVCHNNSQNIDEIALLETQVSKAAAKKKILDSQSSLFVSESFDLPPTQISNISSKGQNVSCVDIDKSFVLPSTQMLDILTQEINLSSTHTEDNESPETNFKINDNEQCPISDTLVLSDTPIMCPNSKELKSTSVKDDQDDNICKNNMNKIISNIKQLVNSLSSNVSENHNVQNISNEASNDKIALNLNNDNTSNVSMDLDEIIDSRNVSSKNPKNVQCNNSENISSKAFSELSSFCNIEEENRTTVQSSDNSDNEEFSLEKLKESLKKSNSITPKKFGVHKHLPQVITTVPVKENLKIKSSNKRTFSFEEVKQLEKPKSQQKPSKNFDNKISENSTNDSNNLDDEDCAFPATQINFMEERIMSNSSKTVENELSDLCVTQRSGTLNKHVKKEKDFAMNISKKEFATSKFDFSQSTDSSVSSIDLDDLPATQVCNNLSSTNLGRIQELPNHNTEIYQNNTSKSNKDPGNYNLKNDSTSKRKNSFGEIINKRKKRMCNQIEDQFHSKKPLDHERILSSEIINLLKENCTGKKSTIKQEKDDFEFVKPSVNMQIFNSSTPVSCLNLNVIKIEKVYDDSLPPTQDTNFNNSENNSLPQTQVNDTNLVDINKKININNNLIFIKKNFLSSSKIKKEPCFDDDDDEVSIIELDTSNVKVKEEIILIDDDDDKRLNCGSNLLNFHVKQEKEIPSETIDVSCIKKEKCSEANILSESELEIKSLNVSGKKTENSNLKCLEEYKIKGSDSAKSKYDCQSYKHVEPKKSSRKSTESDASKKDNKSSKNSHISKDKVIQNSFDQRTSKEKSKKTPKNHVSEENSIISKNRVPNEKNRTLEDFSLCHEKRKCLKDIRVLKKKGDFSEESKLSKKEIRDSHNPQTSQEKNRRELKDSYSFKEEIKVKSTDSHVSKANKDKINKTDTSKLHSKNYKIDSIDSASKGKEKVDKCGSLSKNINSNTKHPEKSKNSSVRKDKSKLMNDQYSENGTVKNKIEKDKEKHFEKENNKHSKKTLEEKTDKSFDKSRCSSEKENKNKNNKEVIFTVKPINKRAHNDTSDQCNEKKRKFWHSFDSESNSSEDISVQLSDLQNGFYNNPKLNGSMQIECNGIANKSTPNDTENANRKADEICSKPSQAAHIKKIHNKQDLKEEIANEVKLVLKPFYNTGLISKEDYKDIMRRAVPKIFMNCHNSINPEKIRKLILNYVSLLNNKS